MKLIRFEDPTIGTRVGLWLDGKVYDLTKINPEFSSVTDILSGRFGVGVALENFIMDSIRSSGAEAETLEYSALAAPPLPSRPRLRIPLEPAEVWACGVTYLRSVKAREAETAVKGIYDRVYEAARPEVFFKATASRCVGPYEPICLRSDSKWNVPEAELAFIVGEGNRIVAYTIGNDMSSRSIEGQNPLYLTQAKVYRGCCALGPAVVTPESIGNPSNLQIECEILRGGRRVFHSETNTSRMKRSLEELLNYLTRDNPIPPGTVCLTGTDIVPPDDFTLRHDDIVRITIENIGALTNPVRQL